MGVSSQAIPRLAAAARFNDFLFHPLLAGVEFTCLARLAAEFENLDRDLAGRVNFLSVFARRRVFNNRQR